MNPMQGPPPQWGPGYGPPQPAPRRGIPAWVWLLVIVFSLPAMGVAGCLVCTCIGMAGVAAQPTPSFSAPGPSPPAPTAAAPDPSSCPKGKVLHDYETGKTIVCTGPATSEPSAGSGCPTLAQYQSIHTGMTRDQVVAVLGPGEQTVQQNIAGISGEILQWKCSGVLSFGILIVQFQNDRVVTKSQQGLR